MRPVGHDDVRYDDVRYDDVRYDDVRYDDVRYDDVRYDDVRYDDVRYDDVRYDDVRYDDVRYDDVRYDDVRYEVWFYREALFICAIRRRRTSLGEALGRGRSPCVPGLIFSSAKRAPSMSLRAYSSLITPGPLPSRARP